MSGTTADYARKPFPEWTLQDATAFVATLADADGDKNREFYGGNGWQGGEGWMSALPTGEGSAEKIAAIQRMYIHEPLIAEAVNNHRDGIIAREPLWRFVEGRPTRSPRHPLVKASPATRARPMPVPTPEEAAADPRAVELEEALTDKWDERDELKTFKSALVTALLYGRAPLRLYLPRGLRNAEGRVVALDLDTALKMLYLDAPDPGLCGVFTSDDTKRQIGVFTYRIDSAEYAELSYLDDTGRLTILRVVGGNEQVQEWIGDLGGRLLIYELARERLIGEGERKNQILGNFAKTLMARQLEMGGWRERNMLNVQPPGYWVDQNNVPWTGATGQRRVTFVPVTMTAGPGQINFYQGSEMIDKDGKFQGFATPSLAYEDPVPLSESQSALASARLSILAATGQLYLAMSGDSEASGVARIQARAVHEARLGESKGPLDGALRWYLEADARMAAALMGSKAGAYNDLRVEANAIIDTGPLTPDEQRVIMERMDKHYLSVESGLALLGSDDPDSELQKIDAEAEKRAANAPPALAAQPPGTTVPDAAALAALAAQQQQERAA